MNKQDKIYVAGHNGMVGSAIVRRLRAEGFSNLLLAGSGELDLRNQQDVLNFSKEQTGLCVPGCRESWRNSGE